MDRRGQQAGLKDKRRVWVNIDRHVFSRTLLHNNESWVSQDHTESSETAYKTAFVPAVCLTIMDKVCIRTALLRSYNY